MSDIASPPLAMRRSPPLLQQHLELAAEARRHGDLAAATWHEHDAWRLVQQAKVAALRAKEGQRHD